MGIMVEVPAMVLTLEAFVKAGVAFLSIGSDDLAQYVLAADRTHPQTSTLADGLHPSVLWMNRQTVRVAQAHNIPVSLCGELASDPEALAILLGFRDSHVERGARPRAIGQGRSPVGLREEGQNPCREGVAPSHLQGSPRGSEKRGH